MSRRDLRGRRFDSEPKLNIKKVIATIVALIVIIMVIVSVVMILQEKNTPEVESMQYFSLFKDNKWGVINSKGDIVIEPNFDEMIIIPDSTKDVFIYSSNVNYEEGTYETTVINSKGEKILTNYSNVEPLDNYTSIDDVWYEENCLKYKKDDKYGLISFSGEELLSAEYDDIYTLKGLERSIIIEKDGKLGLYNDVSKTIILDTNYTEIKALGTSYNDGYIVKDENDKYGIIGPDQKTILEISYDNIKDVYGSSKYVVEIEDKAVVVNKNGDTVLELEDGESIVGIVEDNFIIVQDDKYGVIDEKRNEILPINYEYIEHAYSDYYIAASSKNYGVLNSDGEIAIEFKYEDISYRTDGALFECENGDYTTDIYNNSCEYKITGTISTINTEKSYIRIRVDDKYKYYNFNFEEKSNVDVLSDNTLFLVKEEGKYGYVNKEGQKVVDCIYDDATEQNEFGFCAVQKNGKWGALKSDGTLILEPTLDLSDNIIIDFIGVYHLDENSELHTYTD